MESVKKDIPRELIDALLITIPAGRIKMKDDRIKKTWEMEIKSFHLSKFPVTQDLYKTVTGENPAEIIGAELPIETVSWIEAVWFCNKLSESLGKVQCYSMDSETEEIAFDSKANGFRLPTEAEWQYACQAGKKDVRYGELNNIAWFKNNSNNTTHKVGQKEPNAWGIYDMLGNVWEWCSDIYDENVYGSYRIFRGGGWCDVERSVMATTRRRSHPYSFKIDDLGFRIAINLK